MIRYIAALLIGLCVALAPARADTDVKIEFQGKGDDKVVIFSIDKTPPGFNTDRDDRFTVDGRAVTIAQLETLVWKGNEYRLCDTAGYFRLYTVWKKDGTTYYKHPDGKYRQEKPKVETCPCAYCGCDQTGECNCGKACGCKDCPAKQPPEEKPATITDTNGNTYTLNAQGEYVGGTSGPKATAPPTSCPNGRCPNK